MTEINRNDPELRERIWQALKGQPGSWTLDQRVDQMLDAFENRQPYSLEETLLKRLGANPDAVLERSLKFEPIGHTHISATWTGARLLTLKQFTDLGIGDD